MIVTLTPDPALDHLWQVPHLASGHHHGVARGTTRAGGRGIDVSRVLHSQGHETVAVATAGGDTGADFAAELASSGVANRIIPVSSPTRRSLGIFSDDGLDATLFDECAITLSDDEVQSLTEATLRIPDATIVAICGALPLGFDPSHLADLVIALRLQGSVVLVDTSGAGLITAARAGADLLTPNRAELAEATGVDDPLAGAQFLVEAGAGAVAVTAGTGAVFVATQDEVVTAELPRPIRCCSAPGAGAAAVAAITAQVERFLIEDAEPRGPQWSIAAELVTLSDFIAPIYRALKTPTSTSTRTMRRIA